MSVHDFFFIRRWVHPKSTSSEPTTIIILYINRIAEHLPLYSISLSRSVPFRVWNRFLVLFYFYTIYIFNKMKKLVYVLVFLLISSSRDVTAGPTAYGICLLQCYALKCLCQRLQKSITIVPSESKTQFKINFYFYLCIGIWINIFYILFLRNISDLAYTDATTISPNAEPPCTVEQDKCMASCIAQLFSK